MLFYGHYSKLTVRANRLVSILSLFELLGMGKTVDISLLIKLLAVCVAQIMCID